MNYKVLITTSGTGSRLGSKTNFTNKSLLRIGTKPSISHIIELYNQDTEFVITLGHFGDYVKQFLKIAYPERKFTFVQVDNYDKPGSSLLFSIKNAKEHLKSPFIFHASDTLIEDKVIIPDHNYIIGSKGNDSSQFATLDLIGSNVSKLNYKGQVGFDLIHIGLVGIYDHKLFFNRLEEIYDSSIYTEKCGDVDIIKDMVGEVVFKGYETQSWIDVGSVSGLRNANIFYRKENFNVLEKEEESIYIVSNNIIKFFNDSTICENRIKRAQILANNTPSITAHSQNFYKYKYIEGKLFSYHANSSNFLNLLKWSTKNLWKPVDEFDQKDFNKKCNEFYFTKTLKRVSSFLEIENTKDIPQVINGENIPSAKQLINSISQNLFENRQPYLFHGDFILDNIIFLKDSKFKLIDWRQDFAGDIEKGDVYYDLGKLSHNLIVNHNIIDKNLFEITYDKEKVFVDIYRYQRLVECENEFFRWAENSNYNIRLIKIIRSLIWLSMSPLHHHPFNKFLFYFGKLNLYKALKDE